MDPKDNALDGKASPPRLALNVRHCWLTASHLFWEVVLMPVFAIARPSVRLSVTIAVLMFVAAGIAYALTPRDYLALRSATVDYESILPKSFGDWIEDPALANQVVNPQQQAQLHQLYSQIVTRTFIHLPTGRRIMLSIAYGRDQSHENQVHKPEVCYPAQGFQIRSVYKDLVSGTQIPIPVMRLNTFYGQRQEPVSYWIRVGDRLVRGAIEQNIARVSFGLKGEIPDGLLFRISEINSDAKASFELQDRFVTALLDALSPVNREALIGRKA